MSASKPGLRRWIEKFVFWWRRDRDILLVREDGRAEPKRAEPEWTAPAQPDPAWGARAGLQASAGFDDEIRLQRLGAGWLRCEACGEPRAPTDFHPDSHEPTGRDQSSCRECRAR